MMSEGWEAQPELVMAGAGAKGCVQRHRMGGKSRDVQEARDEKKPARERE